MLIKKNIFLFMAIFTFFGCQENWDDYYEEHEPTVDQNMWEQISKNPKFSMFVEYVVESGVDTLFKNGNAITVFIPDNEAFASFNTDTTELEILLKYHFIQTVVNIRNIGSSRKMETSGGKYTLLENNDQQSYIDGVNITYSSPLFANGRYYIIDEVLFPKPTLYEYISDINPVLKDYIDEFDSVYLNINESTPIGYDESGNTIYDSVFSYINIFDSLYFPIQNEFRNRAATMVIFDEEQYRNALTGMALNLGDGFNSYEDIPKKWQYNVLLPELIDKRIFGEPLHYTDFEKGYLKNVSGDTVFMDQASIDSESRFVCSNGIVFKYNDFYVADSLYKGELKVQGESLVELIGAGVFGFKEGVTITGTGQPPTKEFAGSADNDSLMNLELGIRYTDEMMLEFFIPDVLPQRYRLVWSANFRPSGLFEVYVNDEMVGEIDLFNFRRTQVSVTGEFFVPVDGINKIDFWVDNIESYGNVKIGLKYIDTGLGNFNGISIDYISLVPENE